MRIEMRLIIAALAAFFAVFSYAAAEEQKADSRVHAGSDEERSIFDEDVREGMHEKMLEMIERGNPERANQLRELRSTSPEQFETEMAEIGKKMQGKFADARKRSKEPDAVTRATDKGDWKQAPPRDEPMRPETPAHKGKDGTFAEPRRGGPARDSYMEIMRKRNEEFLEWLKVNYPHQASEFEKANEANPERAFRDLMPVMMRYRGIFETEKKNPELASLMKKDIDLVDRQEEILRAIKSTEDGKGNEALTAELMTVVAARFDLILKKRQMRFDELKERLTQLENEIRKQEADLEELSKQRDEQTQKRVAELLADDTQIKWD